MFYILQIEILNFVNLVNAYFFKLVLDADICKGTDWYVLPTQLSPK